MQEIDYKSALSRMASYCSKSEQCIKNVIEKMAKWELTKEEKEEIIHYLIQEKYIDERRYAEFYAKDKHRFQQWGKNKIGMMLRAKEISEENIRNALSLIESDDYEEQLYELLESKFKKIKYESLYDAKGKLFRYGCSKGFESELVLKTCDKIINGSLKK